MSEEGLIYEDIRLGLTPEEWARFELLTESSESRSEAIRLLLRLADSAAVSDRQIESMSPEELRAFIAERTPTLEETQRVVKEGEQRLRERSNAIDRRERRVQSTLPNIT